MGGRLWGRVLALVCLALGAAATTIPLRRQPRRLDAISHPAATADMHRRLLDGEQPMLTLHEFDGAEVTLDEQGNVVGASVALAKLGALNPAMWAYFASLKFQGNQSMDMLVDTGSSAMGASVQRPSTWKGKSFELVNENKAQSQRLLCGDERCRGICTESNVGPGERCAPAGGYCSALDGTDYCSFVWKYSDGSNATGIIMSSEVQLGGLNATALFGGIMNASQSFFEMPDGGGIMGLSFGNYSLCTSQASCFPTIIDELTDAHPNIENKFAFCADGDRASLVVGRGDKLLQASPIQYVPLQEPHSFYFVRILDVRVGNASILTAAPAPGAPPPPRLRSTAGLGGLGGAAAAGNKNSQHGLGAVFEPARFAGLTGNSTEFLGMVDSGNSACVLPPAVFLGLKQQLGACLAPPEHKLFESRAVHLSAERLSSLPKLSVVLDYNVSIILSPRQYLLKIPAQLVTPGSPAPLYALMFYTLPRVQFVVLGQTFLSHTYFEVDRDAKTIGFARPSPGCSLKAEGVGR